MTIELLVQGPLAEERLFLQQPSGESEIFSFDALAFPATHDQIHAFSNRVVKVDEGSPVQ